MLPLLLAACISLAGCGDRTAPAPSSREPGEESSTAPRWVHRYVPVGHQKYRPDEDRWRPEAEVPRVRETTPGMVIWEVSEYPPGAKPTPEQTNAAAEFVERCYQAAVRNGWDRFEKGLADGYRGVDRHHYRNDEYMVDDQVLDPDHPEALMYYTVPPVGLETAGKQRLAGFMFYGKTRESRGPQFGGPLTVWHFHSWYRGQCVDQGLGIGWAVDGSCERGEVSYSSGEMMHVWMIDRSEGPFATPMFIPQRTLVPLLEQRLEERGF